MNAHHGSTRLIAAALLLSGITAVASAPAQATPADDITISDTDILTEVAPAVAGETDAGSSTVALNESSTTAEIAVAESAGEKTASGVKFTVDYAVSTFGETDGLTVLATENESVAAHVQPTGFGVRVLTVIADEDAPREYDYTFDVPASTELVDADGLSYLIGDDLYGAILDPWAVDAAGRQVPTRYTWAGGVLTQHVDLDTPGITYPVVADPAWTYAYKFETGAKTASSARSLLKSCFNCYFPVSGAPRAFPVPGQILPLKALGALNFECKFRSETYNNVGK